MFGRSFTSNEKLNINHEDKGSAFYLGLLKDSIHSTVFSTIDSDGNPSSRIIDIMLVKDTKIYFLTANTKPFYQQIIENPYVSITGVLGDDTMSSLSLTVKGKAKEIGTNYLSEIFEENTYMSQLYPTDSSRQILRVFEIDTGILEVIDLSKKPIYQKELSF